jgi:hypothetical protein
MARPRVASKTGWQRRNRPSLLKYGVTRLAGRAIRL